MDNSIARKNTGGRNYTSSRDYLKDLDALLKRNKGSSTFVAQDTSSNRAYTVPGAKAQQPLPGGLAQQTLSANYIPAPEYPVLPELPAYPEEMPVDVANMTPEEYQAYIDSIRAAKESGFIQDFNVPMQNAPQAPFDPNADERTQIVNNLIAKGYSPNIADFISIPGVVLPNSEKDTLSRFSGLRAEQGKKYLDEQQFIDENTSDAVRTGKMYADNVGELSPDRELANARSLRDTLAKKATGAAGDVLGAFAPTPAMAAPKTQSNISTKPQQNIFKNKFVDSVNNVGQKVEDTIEGATAKAGQGIQSLKNTFQGVADDTSNVFKKIDLSSIGGKKVVGEDSGNTPDLSSPNLVNTKPQNDTRDNFFKAGGADIYKNYLKPGIDSAYQGGLSLDLFNNDFFQDANNVANVFGKTFLGKEATNKYRNYINEQFPILSGDDDETRSYNEYNQSVRQSIPDTLQSDFSWDAPRTSRAAAPRSQAPYMTAQPAMKYATPQSKQAPQAMMTPRPSNQYSTPMAMSRPVPQSRPSQQMSTPAPRISTPAPQPQQRSTPVASIPRSMPTQPQRSTPVPQSKPQPQRSTAPMRSTPAPQSKPVQNIFKTISNLFRR